MLAKYVLASNNYFAMNNSEIKLKQETPEKSRSVARKILGVLTDRKVQPLTEEKVREQYETIWVKRQPMKELEIPAGALQKLEKTTGWAIDDTVEDLTRKTEPAQIVDFLQSLEKLGELNEVELAAHIITGMKIKVMVVDAFCGEHLSALPIGQSYPVEQSDVRGKALAYSTKFLQTREGVKTRLQRGMNSPDQIIVTW